MPSGGIQSLVEEADSDVLLLYDCCNSAATTTSESRQDRNSVTEVIAACGYESIAPEVGEHSFTNSLVEILAAASKGTPFSIGELHNLILNRLKCWVPSILKDQNGKMKEGIGGRPEYERQPRRTPVYSILCDTKPRRSIMLAPLRKRYSSLSTGPTSNGHAQSIDLGTAGTTRKRRRSLSPGQGSEKCSQVIISVQLRGHELDIAAWKECIRLFPSEAQTIKIEGIFESFSTLLLVRIPVAIWNLIPDNPAYGFVGYVTSENQATPQILEELNQKVPVVSTQHETRAVKSENGSPLMHPTSYLDQLRTMSESGSPMEPLPDLNEVVGLRSPLDLSSIPPGYFTQPLPENEQLSFWPSSANANDWLTAGNWPTDNWSPDVDFHLNDAFSALSHNQPSSLMGLDFSSIDQSAFSTTISDESKPAPKE